MEGLSIFLPPFSPDYSGAASVFFGLNSLIVLHDADGCTCNYTSFDEPRWYGSRKPVYSSGLREIDAVLGDDDKFVKRITDAAQQVNPELIAVIGSPVPMVIGTDMQGIANELEMSTGIPTFGFGTTGVRYYKEGISEAFLALAKRFMRTKSVEDLQEKQKKTVNIIGLTPLDFGKGENVENMKRYLTEGGWTVIASLMMDTTLEKLEQAPSAAVNLVVSSSGLALAKWMQTKFAIPYVVGTPIEQDEVLLQKLARAAETGESDCNVGANSCTKGKILWIGEQVIGNSLRNLLEYKYGVQGMVVASPYGLDATLAREQDVNLSSEVKIAKEINKSEYRVVIADPLMKKLIKQQDAIAFCDVPQVAISSKLYWDRGFAFQGEDMNGLIDTIRGAV